jgi:hypothetical protein
MNKEWQPPIDAKRRVRLLRSLALLLGSLSGTNSSSQQLRNRYKHPTNPVWENLLDVASPERDRQVATPLFWHIHKAGGTTLHDFLSSCLNLTLAAEVGALSGHQDDLVRKVVCRSLNQNCDYYPFVTMIQRMRLIQFCSVFSSHDARWSALYKRRHYDGGGNPTRSSAWFSYETSSRPRRHLASYS